MKRNVRVSASILCADFTKLGDEIKKCEDSGVDRLHVDVMDGHFVPNLSIGAVIIEAIRPKTKLPIDVHLMVDNPSALLDLFLDAGADIISVHAECYGTLRENCRQPNQFPKEVDSIEPGRLKADIQRIKARGKKAYVAFNPGTPLCIESLLVDLNGVLIMSVNPGFAKQKFMPAAIPKIQELAAQFDRDISVDGGVNALTAPEVVQAGANVLVTASYFFGAPDPRKVVKELKALSAS